MPENKALPRKKIKNITLQKQMEREFKRLRKEIELIDNKEASTLILSACLWFIVERNRSAIESLRLSDFLKHEPYVDHWFFKLASEYSRTRGEMKKKNRKTKANKFGIFNIKK
jgi:DNA helicase IV